MILPAEFPTKSSGNCQFPRSTSTKYLAALPRSIYPKRHALLNRCGTNEQTALFTSEQTRDRHSNIGISKIGGLIIRTTAPFSKPNSQQLKTFLCRNNINGEVNDNHACSHRYRRNYRRNSRPKSPDTPIYDTIVVQPGPPLSRPESSAAQRSAKLPANDKPTYQEAISGLDAEKWRAAMMDELQNITENHVWQLTPPPHNRRALGLRWVLTVKRGAQGNVERYKARLVVQGFGQEFGFDYDETYAPFIRMDNVRLLFAIGAHYRQTGIVIHIDFNNAFQNGGADYNIYIRQPPGFIDQQTPNHVLLLHKSLYGLKQAPRIWFFVLCQLILDLGFIECQTDKCTFYSNDRRILIAVYVDDILMLGKPDDNERCVNELSRRFKLRSHGPVKLFLGLNVEYTEEGIHLNQIRYIHQKAQEFNLTAATPYDTPLDPSLPLVQAQPNDKLCDQISYQELTGSLNHLAITSRPDISFAVSRPCQKFNSKPTSTHLKAARRVLQ